VRSQRFIKKVSIVLPVYNNEESLPELFERLNSVCYSANKDLQVATEIIIVDDGSIDESWSTIARFHRSNQRVTAIKLSRNFGSHSALMESIKFINGDSAIFISADLQDPPELIRTAIEEWLTGSEFVVFVRSSRQDKFWTRFFSRFFYSVVRQFAAKDYPRLGFDIFLLESKYLKQISDASKNTFFHTLVWSIKNNPKTISYERVKRKYGKSGWTFKKRVHAALDAVLGSSIAPIRIISLSGLIVLGASFVLMLTIIFRKINGDIEIAGYVSIITAILFCSGTIILNMAVLGEYIARIYLNTDGKPRAIIERVLS
jgi:dolichol-phosphate mannosyltransferase